MLLGNFTHDGPDNPVTSVRWLDKHTLGREMVRSGEQGQAGKKNDVPEKRGFEQVRIELTEMETFQATM